jgi:tol-pal system protein YbgF
VRHLFLLAAAAVSVATISLPVQAGLFDDTEARAWIDDLRNKLGDANKRLGETEKKTEILGRNQLEFANQREMMNAELARMRGQIEVLTYELEATQKRQKDFYVDLDNRLRKLETPSELKADPAPRLDPHEETASYEAAVAALKSSQYKPAADGLLAFIQKYPNSTLLAGAHYWAGYAYSQLKEHVKAAAMFGKFAATWPNDERVPGALESQVASLEMAKDIKGARAAIELLANKYPNSDAGKRAKLKLPKPPLKKN